MKMHVDLIIEARWLLPIIPRNMFLENQAVIIQSGKIIDICNIAAENNQYESVEIVKLNDHILIPGLINLHAHAAMNLMRGLADDLPLSPWLEKHIWPAEKKLLSPGFVYDGTLLACAEMLSSGITTFSDMYFYPEAAAEASLKAGLRAHLGLVVMEFPTQYANDAESYINKGTQTRDQFKNDGRISFNFAPHAPYTVSDNTFEQINTLAAQLNIGLHIHLHETLSEITQSEQKYGMRPLARLKKLGLLDTNTTFAHCVHMNEMEIQALAEHGCSIAHCPTSNLKLGSGIAPIAQCIAQNINVGLGSDSAASNNRLDILSEMRMSALLAKGFSHDATIISAFQALEMATINGAKAMNLDDKIGSIEVGKLADLVAINLGDINMQPCFNPVSHVVHVAGREQVSHVWVNGDLKYYKPDTNNGVFSHIEPLELVDLVAKWQDKLTEFQINNPSKKLS